VQYYLGTFDNIKEASDEYEKIANEWHGFIPKKKDIDGVQFVNTHGRIKHKRK